MWAERYRATLNYLYAKKRVYTYNNVVIKFISPVKVF